MPRNAEEIIDSVAPTKNLSANSSGRTIFQDASLTYKCTSENQATSLGLAAGESLSPVRQTPRKRRRRRIRNTYKSEPKTSNSGKRSRNRRHTQAHGSEIRQDVGNASLLCRPVAITHFLERMSRLWMLCHQSWQIRRPVTSSTEEL